MLMSLPFSYRWHRWYPQGDQKQRPVGEASGGYVFRCRSHGLFSAQDTYLHRGNDLSKSEKSLYIVLMLTLNKEDWNNMTWEEAVSTPLNAYRASKAFSVSTHNFNS